MVYSCLIVVSAKEETTIAVLEDAYVMNADYEGKNLSNNNYGSDTEIHLRTGGASLTRYGYIKFDISSLEGVTDFTCIDLELTLTVRQLSDSAPLAAVEVYGAPTDWSESEITFSNRPREVDLITVNKSITANKVSNAFSITDYVRQALAAGEKTIALFLVENTPGFNLHTRFASKENGDPEKAPKLRVYYGTKTDDQIYDGVIGGVPYVYMPSNGGIDTLFGEVTKIYNIAANEDTFLQGGEYRGTNFGSSEVLEFKHLDEMSSYHRVMLIKFDLSEFKANKLSRAEILLNCNLSEQAENPRDMLVYSCDPYAWDEMTVTLNTAPRKEELVASFSTGAEGLLRIDVTEYVQDAVKNGEKLISFLFEGTMETALRMTFDSRETKGGDIPTLKVVEGERGFATYMEYKGENPWDVAVERVSAWLHRWEDIKARGDMETDIVVKDESEYSLTVGATTPGKSNGYDTQYTPFATRTMDTLKDFTADKSEVVIYDIYGGLMNESMKQEATGFFYTKKIGDRWWTIDPLGYPYYKTGVVQITHGSSPNQKERTLSLFGSKEAWGEAATARLKELGFNAVGGWSDIDTLSKVNAPLNQTRILDILLTYAGEAGVTVMISNTADYVDGVLPVFDPAFSDFAKNRVKNLAGEYNAKDYIYGWMSDNELPADLYMLDATLNLNTSVNSAFNYSYATAWTFMYLKTGKSNVTMADITDELRREYRAMVFDRYFEVACDALERYTPCHQYMGSRFIDKCYKDEYIMRVAGTWCDVVSINYYGAWEGDPELMANMEKWAGKPFVVTEWYAKGMDVWEKDNRMTNRSGAGWTVKDQNDRGKFYHNYALMLMECKGCVGFDWFQYWDNDPDNLNADLSNRNSNKGIYSSLHEEYTELTEYMTELNNQKYYLIEFFDAR